MLSLLQLNILQATIRTDESRAGGAGIRRWNNGVRLVHRANEAGAQTVHRAGGGQRTHRPHNVVAEVVHHQVARAVLVAVVGAVGESIEADAAPVGVCVSVASEHERVKVWLRCDLEDDEICD